MKRPLNLVLLLALATGTLATTAMAQTDSRTPLRDQARIEFATSDSGQTNSLLQQTDWNEYRRCDGNHDQDDRGCHVGPRHHYRSYDGATGYYDRRGHWQAYGWYDRYGNWHPYR